MILKPHICGLTGDGYLCPACEIVEEQRERLITCDGCGEAREVVVEVCVSPRTMSEPAEYEYRCPKCLPKRRWTRRQRLEAMADAGIDTWADAKGER